MNKIVSARTLWSLLLVLFVSASTHAFAGNIAIFNVKDYGATGVKADNATPSIQKAIDACGTAGGGMVYLPPGEYTSGILHLHSHVRFHIEGGATLFASKDMSLFASAPRNDQESLFYADHVEDVTLEGRGTVDGQNGFIWRQDDLDDVFVRPAKDLMRSQGKSLLRSFPEGYPDRKVYPHLVYMGDSTNIRITGLSFVNSQSWTMAFHAIDRLFVDSIYVYTKPNDAVWADGIDMDGCRDVHISNSSITTGDDCLVFISGEFWGPARTCENITVTNCRLTASANAVKFSEGNIKGVQHVTIDNCVINDGSSGFSFAASNGGFVRDVVISNITMNMRRFDWFWGQGGFMGMTLKTPDEYHGKPVSKDDPAPGSISNIMIRNIIVHSKGRAHIDGHPNSWIDGLTMENIKFFVGTDPSAPFDWTTNAMQFHWVRNLKLKGIEVHWEEPEAPKWTSAISIDEAANIEIDDFTGRQAYLGSDVPAIVLKNVDGAMIRDSKAPEGTATFLKITGAESQNITLFGNDLRLAKVPIQFDSDVQKTVVTAMDNFMPAQ
jgi:polygalacturonase